MNKQERRLLDYLTKHTEKKCNKCWETIQERYTLDRTTCYECLEDI